MYRLTAPFGYYALTDSEVLWPCLQAVQHLKDEQLHEALEEMFNDAFSRANYLIRKVHSLQATIFGLPNGVYAEYRRPLAHIVTRYLFLNGRCDTVPQVLNYRIDPSMNVEELALLAMNKDLNTVGLPLPKGEAVLLPIDLKHAIVHFIRRAVDHFRAMKPYIAHMRAYLNELAYRLEIGSRTASTLTQWEKSFLLHMTSRRYGLTTEEAADPSFTVDLRPSEHKEDKTVNEVIDEVKKWAGEGPKTKYLAMLSNGVPEDMVAYVGPYVPQLLAAVGFVLPLGGFSELKFSMQDSLIWDKDEHLVQIMDDVHAISVAGMLETSTPASKTLMSSHMKVALSLRIDQGPANRRIPMVLDLPELIWEYENKPLPDGKIIGKIVLSYYSKWRKRTLRSITNMNEFFFDKVIVNTKMTSESISSVSDTPAAGGQLSIDKYSCVDLSVLRDEKRFPKGQQRIIPLATKVPFTYAIGKRIEHGNADLADYFVDIGDETVAPAFSEFYRVKLGDLLIEQKAMEERVASRLGLTYADRMRSKIGIRVGVNMWRLQNLFGVVISEEKKKNINQIVEKTMQGI